MDEWVVRIDAKPCRKPECPTKSKKDTKRRLSRVESFSFVWITEVKSSKNNHEPHEVHSKEQLVWCKELGINSAVIMQGHP